MTTFLKPNLNCWSSVALSCVDKFTTAGYNFVSVIGNVAFCLATFVKKITQFVDHVKIRLISRLI